MKTRAGYRSRRMRRGRFLTPFGQLVLLVFSGVAVAAIAVGLLIGPAMITIGAVAPPQRPSVADEVKLLEAATNYVFFWEWREMRLETAAVRFGWNDIQIAKAKWLIEVARPKFEKVETILAAWGLDPEATYENLDQAIGELPQHLSTTFCKPFRLTCRRGVPLDEAHFTIQFDAFRQSPEGVFC